MERLLARPHHAPHNRVAWLCVTFLYVLATNAMTLALASLDFRFQALWLSNAGLLSASLLAPVRHRAGLCIAALSGFLLSGIASGGAVAATLVLSMCYIVEALIACVLIERTPGGRIDLTRLRGLSHFLISCAGPAPMASCALWFVWQFANGQPVSLHKAMQWQVSHGLGLIIVVPMILAAYSRIIIGRNLRGSEILEALFLAAVLLAISAAVFAQPLAVLYLILPFICLAAFRTGFLGSGLAVIVVAAVATTFTVLNLGPITYTSDDPEIRILLIQIFVACCVFTALPICVVLTDRNRLTHSLSTSERRFRELAEAAPIGIFTIAPDARITYANHELAQIAGRPVDALMTERFGEALEPDTRDAIDAALLSCNVDQRLAEVSFGMERDGEGRWFQIHFAPMLDDEQRQVGWIGTVMDVSALRRSELHIARSEAELRLLADNASDVICRIDESGLILYASSASERLLDEARRDIVGRHVQDFLRPADRERVLQAVADLAKGSSRDICQFRWSRFGAEDLWVEAVFRAVDEPGGKRQLIVAISDISRRKADEAEILAANVQLRETNRLLELAEGLAEIGHWSFSTTGLGTHWSDTFYKIHGLQIDKPFGLDEYLAMVEPDDVALLRHAIAQAVNLGEKFDVTTRIRRPDGAIRVLEIQGQGELDADGRLTGVFGVCHDVTAHLAAQDELRMAHDRAMSAVEARSRFLAVMSHEVRTPMTGVLATFELLARYSTQINWPLSDMPRLITSTQAQARTLMTILNNVLDQAKLEAGRIELEAVEFDPAIVLADTVELFATQAQAKGLVLLYDEYGPGPVIGDPGRVHQIVANLLSNAIKFTQAGTVELSCDDDGEGYYRIAIKDTGIGISEDALTSIVEPFAQAERSTNRKFGGTGLGLSIISDLADAMGGKLHIESAIGIGSTFAVRLPKRLLSTASASLKFTSASAVVAPVPAPPAASVDVGICHDLRGVRIMVVDDTDATRLAAQAQLQVLGCDPVGATGGVDAITQILEQTVDLLLIDSAMPELDGAATIRLLRLLPGTRGEIPILGFTAYSQGELQQDLLDSGACGMVVKPFSTATLQDAVMTALGTRDANRRVVFAMDDALASYPIAMREDLITQLLLDLERLRAEVAGSNCGRAIHSLKGIAGAFGLNELERICNFLEIFSKICSAPSLPMAMIIECTDRAYSEVLRVYRAM